MGRSFVQLSFDERRIIARMHEKKISQAEIARALRRDRSTIWRELRRNFWHDREVPIAEGYWHVTAHALTKRHANAWGFGHRRRCSASIYWLLNGNVCRFLARVAFNLEPAFSGFLIGSKSRNPVALRKHKLENVA